MLEDTIAAIATPPGPGALAVLRVSGPEAARVGEAVGLGRPPVRRAVLRRLLHPEDGRTVDRVLVTRFEAPRSYTGEDMLEIGCHGGPLGPQLALDALLAAGARQAEAGEFTRRAVLRGRMDLVQAEAVGDLVDARSPAARRAALRQLERGLSRRLEELRDGILQLEALLAYDIDFPDEDGGPVPPERVDEGVRRVRASIETLLRLAPEGELLRDGALTVIAGRPNVGKSSLFNYLVGSERAIVTEHAGTTRDAVEALVAIDGYPFRLVDTAGLRDEADPVERLGIEVARSYLARADLVLLCVEAGTGPGAEERTFVEREVPDRERLVVVRTKADLAPDRFGAGGGLEVSVRSGAGLEGLRRTLAERAFAGLRRHGDAPLVTRERHRRALEAASAELEAFVSARRAGQPAEVVATHLRAAATGLEELLGGVTVEEVLDAVFREFCVGK